MFSSPSAAPFQPRASGDEAVVLCEAPVRRGFQGSESGAKARIALLVAVRFLRKGAQTHVDAGQMGECLAAAPQKIGDELGAEPRIASTGQNSRQSSSANAAAKVAGRCDVASTLDRHCANSACSS